MRKHISDLRDQADKLERFLLAEGEQIQLKKEKKNKIEPGASNALWSVYCEEYYSKWKKEPPPRNAMVNGQLAHLKRTMGDKSESVIRHYFKMKDVFFHKQFHPVGLLIKQAHTICASMDTGRHMTNTEMNNLDKMATTQKLIEKVQNGEL